MYIWINYSSIYTFPCSISNLSHMDASTIILGFTGSISSGCTYISKTIPSVANVEYKYFKLSKVIREFLEAEGNANPTVEQMQDRGNQLRNEHGNGYIYCS